MNTVFVFLFLLKLVSPHSHHLHNPHRERNEDGSYSARDHAHYSEKEHNANFDHEAILGSVKEAEEYNDLPPTEAKRRLEILLPKMDRNNDEYIDRKELHSWILRSFRKLSEEESEERFIESDADDDGFVTWEEYIYETYGIKNPEDFDLLDQAEREEERSLMKEDRELFNAADEDLDGKLNHTEFFSFSHPEEHPKMINVLWKQTLEEKDADKDGFISFQEYVGVRGNDEDEAWLKTEKAKFDNDLDKDGDGIMDRQEIIDWVVPSNEEIAEEEVVHLFESVDDDSDEMLRFDEILDHYDIFVGSEATDYGDHLHNLDRFEDEL